jgi:hypothetical protein
MKLNEKGVEHAKQLIEDGKYVVDTDWSEEQPSTEELNQFIEEHGEEAFARWNLGIDSEHEGENVKELYDFPYGDLEKVHRSGLIAAEQRAGQYDYDEVGDAANELVSMIDEREGE